MLWTTLLQMYTPFDPQIYILQIFSNFWRFLHKIWLFYPKNWRCLVSQKSIKLFRIFCNIIETNHSSRNSQGSTFPTQLRCPSLKLHIKNVQVFILSYFTYFCHILLLKNHFFTPKLNCILVFIFFNRL